MASRLGRVTTFDDFHLLKERVSGNGFQTWKGYDYLLTTISSTLRTSGNGFQTWKGYDKGVKHTSWVAPGKWEWLPDLEGLRLLINDYLVNSTNKWEWLPDLEGLRQGGEAYLMGCPW